TAGDQKEPPNPAKARKPVELTEEGMRIHKEALLIDGHNDLPWMFREKKDLSFRKIDLMRDQTALHLHTDIARLRKGNVGAQFWSAFVPAETARTGTAIKETLEQIDLIHRLVKAYPDTFALARTADDVERIRKEGKIASLIG